MLDIQCVLIHLNVKYQKIYMVLESKLSFNMQPG